MNGIPNFNGMNSPYGVDITKMQQQLASQYNQINNYQIINSDKYNEIQKIIASLSIEEKTELAKDEEFILYNQQYEQGLLSFIASQFRNQFNSTPEGSKCLDNLDKVLNTKVKDIKKTLDEERLQMKELSELIKNNPELLDQLKSKNK